MIWQIQGLHNKAAVQRDFLKYVAQRIKYDLVENHPHVLSHFEVNKKDRKYQFWKKNALSVDLYTSKVFLQKLDYIHTNPVKAGLCELPEEYKFSSARFYIENRNGFSFLSHYEGAD